jgi:hypothetical protein
MIYLIWGKRHGTPPWSEARDIIRREKSPFETWDIDRYALLG